MKRYSTRKEHELSNGGNYEGNLNIVVRIAPSMFFLPVTHNPHFILKSFRHISTAKISSEELKTVKSQIGKV